MPTGMFRREKRSFGELYKRGERIYAIMIKIRVQLAIPAMNWYNYKAKLRSKDRKQ
jgi:hypothetical protein